jgi:hypothetical protein
MDLPVNKTAIFLRMTAVQMRALAERAPQIATELLHIAAQLEAEAEELSSAG